MNVNKIAKKDAEKWLSAEMFYGEGSGVRRKLLTAEFQGKYEKIPGYVEAFDKFYGQLDQNKYAAAAIKERKKIDRAKNTERNVRGVLTGNKHSMTTNLLVITTVVYIAHETGYDRVVIEYGKQKVADAKVAYRRHKNSRKVRPV